MSKGDRVSNDLLCKAGLELMRQAGRPLTEVPTKGRAMIYRTPTQETVRLRTCNDHLLVVRADRDEPDARLNVEGTDYILIVMPEVPRAHGAVVAYLVPTREVVKAAHTTHREWLATTPNTKGNNRTWNLWFDDSGPEKANGFARKWQDYKLSGTAATAAMEGASHANVASQAGATKLGDVINAAKQRIAEVAGVPLDAIRISIDLA